MNGQPSRLLSSYALKYFHMFLPHTSRARSGVSRLANSLQCGRRRRTCKHKGESKPARSTAVARQPHAVIVRIFSTPYYMFSSLLQYYYCYCYCSTYNELRRRLSSSLKHCEVALWRRIKAVLKCQELGALHTLPTQDPRIVFIALILFVHDIRSHIGQR